MQGINSHDPGAFSVEIGIMKAMRWSWAELMDTPYAVVAEIAQRLESEHRWSEEKRRLDEVMNRG